jgi:hypothetical protein
MAKLAQTITAPAAAGAVTVGLHYTTARSTSA